MLKLKAIHREKPWPHLFFEEVFEEIIYPELLEHLPPTNRLRMLKGYPNRKICPLVGRQGFWGEVRKALTSEKLTEALKKRLGITKDCYPKAAICRDLPGYYIAPHTDASYKVMTLVIFLPKDDSQHQLGTVLFGREDGKIITAKQLGFFPNVGFAFKVTSESWHEVSHVPPGKPRDTIQVCYFSTPKQGWI